jgi:hypothetical protein
MNSVSYNTATGAVKLVLAKGESWSPEAYLRISTPSREGNAVRYDTPRLKQNGRGAYVIHVSSKPAVINLKVTE